MVIQDVTAALTLNLDESGLRNFANARRGTVIASHQRIQFHARRRERRFWMCPCEISAIILRGNERCIELVFPRAYPEQHVIQVEVTCLTG